jgi:hypothetical protein
MQKNMVNLKRVFFNDPHGRGRRMYGASDGALSVAPQILIVLFLIYLFDNIIQLISLRNLWYYGGW